MLRRVEDLIGFAVQASDGEAGEVDDLYFDGEEWVVRYFVVSTGGWLSGRKVLLSPEALLPLVWEKRAFPTRLTREQIENSPEVDLDRPVSRQQLGTLHDYYHWPVYWTGTVPMGHPPAGTYSATAMQAQAELSEEERAATEIGGENPHLRSAREVLRYRVCAEDGNIGHISDLLVDEADWNVHYLIVNTEEWLIGRHVLVSKDWVDRIDWPDSCFYVTITREQVKDSPEYDPQRPVSREYERDIHEYYGVPGYWMW